MVPNYEKLLEEAKPLAIKASQDFASIANGKPTEEIAVFYGLCSSLVLQICITTLATGKFRVGSPEGEKFIEKMYGEAFRDAKERWHKQDLKDHFETGN